MAFSFDRIAIIGLGLIGSSIARAAHERRLAAHIIGCDRNDIALAYAKKHGFIHEALHNPAEAVKGCGLVILATPPSTLAAIAKAIAPALSPDTIVMDTCSVKEAAIGAIAPHLPPGVEYIPAHPIAGTEKSGVEAGRGDLFECNLVIVTPEKPEITPALIAVTAFWQAVGARFEAMPAPLHDRIYAYVSHLPHLLAFAAASLPGYDAAAGNKTMQRFLRLSGSGPTLWSEIFITNKNNIISVLNRYIDVIYHIIDELVQAPDGSPSESDEKLAQTVLFPRIAASCLVTTVMEAEKQSGFAFAKYAGTGFADFTAPVSQSPDEDIENISNQYQYVLVALKSYALRLKVYHDVMTTGDAKQLQMALTENNQS